MERAPDRISLRIDLTSGTIELDAPAASFEHAIEKTKELASSLDLPQARAARANAPQVTNAAPEPAPSSAVPMSTVPPLAPVARRQRKLGGPSAARTGRIGSFEEVRGLLTEPQERDLRAFYETKRPTEQPDQVLVAMCKGEELLGKKGFTYNEIYTLMRLAGERDLPRALDVVLSRMQQEQFVVREGAGFATKFVGRDRVERGFGTPEA